MDKRRLVRTVVGWFEAEGRDLPWRTSPRDPYRCLVSEVMLQQTQVARILPSYERFVSTFPTLESLADADEHTVLRLWSGLGYYGRARRLLAAARVIRDEHGGCMPEDVRLLRRLPGVGPYTAGAIASLVFGRAEPAVDGNVARVLLRLHGRRMTQADGVRWAWDRAAELVRTAARADRVTAFNEGLMELGAMVCTPRGPACSRCPARRACLAARRGTQEQIPVPKSRTPRRSLYCASVVVRDEGGRFLVERRGDDGLWGGLWQAPTIEREDRFARPAELAARLGVARVYRAGEFTHATTHRAVRFRVYRTGPLSAAQRRLMPRPTLDTAWVSRDRIGTLALSNAQRRILLGA